VIPPFAPNWHAAAILLLIVIGWRTHGLEGER